MAEFHSLLLFKYLPRRQLFRLQVDRFLVGLEDSQFGNPLGTSDNPLLSRSHRILLVPEMPAPKTRSYRVNGPRCVKFLELSKPTHCNYRVQSREHEGLLS